MRMHPAGLSGSPCACASASSPGNSDCDAVPQGNSARRRLAQLRRPPPARPRPRPFPPRPKPRPPPPQPKPRPLSPPPRPEPHQPPPMPAKGIIAALPPTLASAAAMSPPVLTILRCTSTADGSSLSFGTENNCGLAIVLEGALEESSPERERAWTRERSPIIDTRHVNRRFWAVSVGDFCACGECARPPIGQRVNRAALATHLQPGPPLPCCRGHHKAICDLAEPQVCPPYRIFPAG
jgi:hypothetical protein